MSTSHHWLIHLDGQPDLTTDDFTLDEVELLEKITGTGWGALNPLGSVKQARGYIAVAAMHAGETETKAGERAAAIQTHGQLKHVFELVLGDAPTSKEGEATDPPA